MQLRKLGRKRRPFINFLKRVRSEKGTERWTDREKVTDRHNV